MDLFPKKTPKFEDFRLGSPPAGLSNVLYLNPRSRFEPMPFTVVGGGHAWMVGWFVLQLPDSGLPRGVRFIVNGTEVQPLIPDDMPAISGCVACITRLSDQTVFVESAREQVPAQLAARLHAWLTREMEEECYRQTFQRIFIHSAGMQRFLSEDPARRSVVRRFHVFETNRGQQTLDQLLAGTQQDSYILATFALDPRHYLIENRFGQALVVGLRDFGTRTFFGKIAADLRVNIDYVDIGAGFAREEPADPSQRHPRLRRWFHAGLRASSFHEDVKVAFGSAEECSDYPAVLVPPARRDFPREVSEEEIDRCWSRYATLLINPRSDLANEILLLIDKEDIRDCAHFPIAIHNLASLLAIGHFSRAHHQILWDQVVRLARELRCTKDQISGLRDKLEEREEQAGQIDALHNELATLKGILKWHEEELASTRKQLDLLLRFTGARIEGWYGEGGASA